MTWGLLAIAIIAEVVATAALKVVSSSECRLWYVVCGLGYLVAFVMLTVVLRRGFPLGVAYGIWSAGGVAATAFVARALFGEALTRRMLLGVSLIVIGVIIVEIGGTT